MKKISFVCLFIVLEYLSSSGQTILNRLYVCYDAGVNFTSPLQYNSVNYAVGTRPMALFQSGPVLIYDISNNISLKSGFYFSSNSNYSGVAGYPLFNTTDGIKVLTLRAETINIPLLIRFNFPVNKTQFFIEVGGSLDYMHGTILTIPFNADGFVRESVSETLPAVCTGIGAMYKMNNRINLTAEIRYSMELDGYTNNFNNKYLYPTLGLMYQLKGIQ